MYSSYSAQKLFAQAPFWISFVFYGLDTVCVSISVCHPVCSVKYKI